MLQRLLAAFLPRADLLLPRMLAMQPHPAYPTYKTASHIMLNR
jgi:hypothetical protein